MAKPIENDNYAGSEASICIPTTSVATTWKFLYLHFSDIHKALKLPQQGASSVMLAVAIDLTLEPTSSSAQDGLWEKLLSAPRPQLSEEGSDLRHNISQVIPPL